MFTDLKLENQRDRALYNLTEPTLKNINLKIIY